MARYVPIEVHKKLTPRPEHELVT